MPRPGKFKPEMVNAIPQIGFHFIRHLVKDPHHRVIVRQHVGRERGNAVLARDPHEVPGQESANTASLMVIVHRDGDFGVVAAARFDSVYRVQGKRA